MYKSSIYNNKIRFFPLKKNKIRFFKGNIKKFSYTKEKKYLDKDTLFLKIKYFIFEEKNK